MIHFYALCGLLLCLVCYLAFHTGKDTDSPNYIVWLILGLGLLLRLSLAATTPGFGTDISCFSAWADRMYQVGPAGFYSPDVFTDYPPGYMYILYVVGLLRHLFSLTPFSGADLILLKLPAILCDIACSYLIYREAYKQLHFSQIQSVFLMTAYLFQPAVILNSSCWGQVDAIHTLIVVLMCIFLMRGKMLPAYAVYGLGILLKPQTLIFTPVLLVGIFDHVFRKDFSWRNFFYNLFGGLGVICAMFLVASPFGLDKVIAQYTDTLGSYPYATVNAYNFWGLLGWNWTSQDTMFLFLPCKTWGTIAILLVVLFAFIIGWRLAKEPSKYFLISAFIILTVFTFSARMHERYMFPGLVLLVFCYLYRPADALWKCFAGFSFLHYYNTIYLLHDYQKYGYEKDIPLIRLVSVGILYFLLYFYHCILRYYTGRKTVEVAVPGSAKAMTESAAGVWEELRTRICSPAAPLSSSAREKMTRTDWILLLLILALYSGFALRDLGDRQAPETTYEMTQGDTITLDFTGEEFPTTLASYLAPWHQRHFTAEVRYDGEETWTYLGEIILDNVFTWQDVSLQDLMVATGRDTSIAPRELRLTLTDTYASLIELVCTDASRNIIRPVNADTYETLFDEEALYPERYSFRNSMYFDEIYHARTAYEYLHGLQSYENTHPPLGKVFISLGIALFGMNPFGWRIVGTLFGIAMLPFLYLFAKQITRNTPVSALACFLFAFDFMHFAQTRIATIDVYITFFVILMYYFMYRYCTMSFYDTPLKKTLLPLGLSGICMGFGVACKWTGVYAGLGLAVLFFGTLFRRYREYIYAQTKPGGTTNGISHAAILHDFMPNVKKTIGFCMIFFVLIPVVIYTLSYLPFVDGAHSGLFKRLLDNQTSMFSYHSGLEATHPYSSSWYQWPTMVRPIWYYSGYISDTVKEGISAFGNPLVWWTGIAAFLYMLYLAFERRIRDRVDRGDRYTAGFLMLGYLAQYMPWFFVTRITFIYHYFPSVPFVVLMIAHSLMQLKKRMSKRVFLLVCILYAAAAFGLFLLFYPVLSGQPVEVAFVLKYLRWQPTWVLISG